MFSKRRVKPVLEGVYSFANFFSLYLKRLHKTFHFRSFWVFAFFNKDKLLEFYFISLQVELRVMLRP